MTRKRSSKETLEVIERSADSDEAARIRALGDEESDRELLAAGFDLEDERAAAEAARQKALRAVDALRVKDKGGSETRRPSLVPRRRKRQNVIWFAAAALAATFLLFFMAPQLFSPAALVSHPRPQGASVNGSELERAAALRRLALDACAAKLWQVCLDGLDDARRIDPVGDGDPTVRTARDRATLELAEPKRDVGSRGLP
jgi:hypothetical protein